LTSSFPHPFFLVSLLLLYHLVLLQMAWALLPPLAPQHRVSCHLP
jgi:hypothetical protein